MVKADLTQDYYGDLELLPTANTIEIKKQFKKLALKYHPDRNPGRESEVNSKFQTIQAAHEVLTDPEQRAKYDAGRVRKSSRPVYEGYKPAPKGNPYSTAGSQWAPPPKPYGTPRAQPAASAGSSRYNGWKAPPSSSTARKPAPGSTEAKNAYEAWDQMKHGAGSRTRPTDIPKSGRAESNAAKHTPPPKSDRPGRDAFRNGETPGSRPVPKPPIPKRPNGYMPGQVGDEPPAANTSSYNTTQYKDRAAPPLPPKAEPPPYQTYSPKAASKQFKEHRASTPYSGSGGEKTNPFEGVNLSRSNSTREGSQRGESSGSNGPGSTSPIRGSHYQGSYHDNDVGSPPKRTQSHADFPGGRHAESSGYTRHNSVPHTRDPFKTTNKADTSSDEEADYDDVEKPFVPKRPRKIATPRSRASKFPSTASTDNINQAGPGTGTRTNESRKLSLREFRRQWHALQNRNEESNNVESDGHADGTGKTQQEGEPTMYAQPTRSPKKLRPLSNLSYQVPHPDIPAKGADAHRSYMAGNQASSEVYQHPFPHINIQSIPVKDSPTSPDCLNKFEMAQLSIVEQLVNRSGGTPRKASGNSNCPNTESTTTSKHVSTVRGRSETRKCERFVSDKCGLDKRHVHQYQSAHEAGSPTKRRPFRDAVDSSIASTMRLPPHNAMPFSQMNQQHANRPNSFTFPTFPTFPTESTPKPFSNISSDNINTTFSQEDWAKKFDDGDYFTGNDQNRNSKAPSRAQSTGSKSRGRSPTKSRSQSRPQTGSSAQMSDIDTNPNTRFAGTSNDTPVESPGGTKFSAEEWSRTFKPQTFAPPPSSPAPLGARASVKKTRSTTFGRTPIISKTAGAKAAMVESPETSEEENVYIGRSGRPVSSDGEKARPMPASASTEPMDIDSPAEKPDPLATHRERDPTTFDDGAGIPRKVYVEPSRAEWRNSDSHTANTTNGLPVQPEIPRKTSPALPPRPTSESKTAHKPEVQNDEEDFADLQDLQNIEPLHNAAKGLDSFGDLGSTLPFPSQASNRTIFKTNITTEELELPNPPKAPQVPSTPSTAVRPTQSSWHSYLAAFKAYMAEWDIFNTAMLSHFVARKQQTDSMPALWLESRDDQWVEMYRKGCREDMRVREWYNVACERHADAMQNFAAFRLRMKDQEEKEAAWGSGMRKSIV